MNLQSQSDTKNLFPTLPGYSQENPSGAWTPPPGPYLLSEVIGDKSAAPTDPRTQYHVWKQNDTSQIYMSLRGRALVSCKHFRQWKAARE